ncbi:MAG: YeeE/YedE family protein [Candidatus Latescibacteria bacterium]|nr:YeeE/YedE family protein [Candidatus Latescibacterota bacterium]
MTVGKAPVGWLIGGVLLGLCQVGAVAIKKPLGVSTQFVVTDTQVLEAVAKDYVAAHPLVSAKKYREPGYGFWLAIGIPIGAAIAAFATGRWRVSKIPAWWAANRGRRTGERFLVCFGAGMLILLGARLAHGCTSGQFASGWAQLSLAAIPFTVGLFGAGMLVARALYPKTPDIER